MVVLRVKSSAAMRPNTVTKQADIFVIVVIVIIWVLVGKIIDVTNRPIKMLPTPRRSSGVVWLLLFS